MALPVETALGPLSFPKEVTLHARAAVAASAALGTKVTIPSVVQDGVRRYPKAVRMQVEKSGAADTFYSLDGNAASASNGFMLPVAPDWEELPYPELLRNHLNGSVSTTNPQICVYSAGSNVQCLFLF